MTHFVDSFPGREFVLNGEKFLYFGGTAYLGLQTDFDFQNLYIENIKKYGTNYGASRKANVRFTIYEEAENHLANIVGSKSCLTLSSGYLSGQLISNYFHKNRYECFYAPETHEAVHQLHSQNHENLDQLILDLKKAVEDDNKNPVLFLDSIDLNGKNYPDFGWLKKLPLEEVILVVDDSHGLGIVGDNGGGVFKSLEKIKSKELIVCGSLGKGFGIQAGIIAGSGHLIEDLKSTDMFAAASPTSPASMATLVDSSKLLSKKRITLKNNIDYFTKCLKNLKALTHIKDYPSFMINDQRMPKYLLTHNIIITDFNYPTKNDNVVQRIVLSAHHTEQDVETLAGVIDMYYTSQK